MQLLLPRFPLDILFGPGVFLELLVEVQKVLTVILCHGLYLPTVRGFEGVGGFLHVNVEVLECIAEGCEILLLLRAGSCHLFPGCQPGQDEVVYRPVGRGRAHVVF
jgi:hypothetical protein